MRVGILLSIKPNSIDDFVVLERKNDNNYTGEKYNVIMLHDNIIMLMIINVMF